jgi:hypothetical protein
MIGKYLNLPSFIGIFPLYAWRTENFKPVLDYDESFIHQKHLFRMNPLKVNTFIVFEDAEQVGGAVTL